MIMLWKMSEKNTVFDYVMKNNLKNNLLIF
jgi:hypothetical protein